MARTLAALLLLLGAFALIAACNDEGDFLLDRNEPEATGTPPFFQRSPLPSPEPSPEGSPLADNATPVPAFEITAEGNVNQRSEPSTQGGEETVVGKLTSGDTATVVANVPGEEVDAGNDIWYQLEDGSFVYSGAVGKVQQ